MLWLLRSELTKAITQPAIALTAASALAFPPVLAVVTALTARPADPRWGGSPVESYGFEVAGFGQPLIILLAALIVGSEYIDHQLQTTLAASPSRGRLAAAKFIIVGASAALIGLVATSAAVLLKHAALGHHGLAPAEFTSAMAWNLGGVVLNYTLMSLIAASLTMLARSPVVTLIVLVPMVLGLTIGLVQALPVLRYLPDLAGIRLLTQYPGVNLLAPAPGALVMTGWALAFASAATFAFSRRDVGG